MANNRKCLLCGSEYSYCPACAVDRRKPSWMAAYDKEDCKIVFETLSAYGMKKITDSEAKKAIKNINIKSMNLDAKKTETINEILGNKSSVVETPVVEVAETPAPDRTDIVIIEKESVVEPIEMAKDEVTDTNEIVENTTFSYRKRNRNNKED